MKRRTFVKISGKLVGTSAVAVNAPALLRAHVRGTSPNDQINVGLIGCRGQGFRVLRQHLDLGGVNCVAMCDIDEQVLKDRSSTIDKDYRQQPQLFRDFRKMLELKDLDAVIIATPDHWHCLQAVYSCEAGKHVYVEKPIANSIAEGEAIVRAAKRYDRIVQVGQQQRSGKIWREVMDYMKSGKLGHIRKTNIWANFDYGLGPLKQPDAPAPDGVDYDLFLGPATKRPFNPARFHGDWRHFWDYGGGLMTDFGAHLIDMALWVKDITTPPETILAYGSHLNRPELAKETFDTMSVVYGIGDYIIQWESSAGKQVGPYDRLYGLAFLGDLGTLVVNRSGWQVLPEWDRKAQAHKTEEFASQKYNEGHDLHIRNFVDALRNGKDLACPPEVGANVALYAHAANIAVRTRSYELNWDTERRKFKNDKAANRLLQPDYRKPWRFPDV